MTNRDVSRFDLFATKFRWISRVVAPDADNFVFVGGELDPGDFGLSDYGGPISLSGKGMALEEAFAGCIGEGIEQLARLYWGDEVLVSGTSRTVDHGLDETALAAVVQLAGHDPHRETPVIDWMTAVRLSDHVPVRVPAAICLRPVHRGAAIPSAISTGCAAGPTLAAATLAALLEVVERDAVALWWLGGRRGRAVGLHTVARADAAGLLRNLRQENEARPTWLLNLTSDTQIPCIAAISATPEGRGFACGTAARLHPADVVRAAMLELCQSELGHRLVAAKRAARGDNALNDVDRRKLDRGQNLDVHACEVLHAAGLPEEIAELAPAGDDAEIRTIVARLQMIGIEPLRVDLTRAELPVPAVRVIAPGLQPFPSSLTTDRLIRFTAGLNTDRAKPPGLPLF